MGKGKGDDDIYTDLMHIKSRRRRKGEKHASQIIPQGRSSWEPAPTPFSMNLPSSRGTAPCPNHAARLVL